MEKRNPVNWFEIAVLDLNRAKKFYSSVFSSKFTFLEMPGMQMEMFEGGPDNMGSAGSLIKSDQNKPSMDGTTIYFSSEELGVELAKVEGAGGKIIMPKTSIGEFGNIALIVDTEGNKIGLHSMK